MAGVIVARGRWVRMLRSKMSARIAEDLLTVMIGWQSERRSLWQQSTGFLSQMEQQSYRKPHLEEERLNIRLAIERWTYIVSLTSERRFEWRRRWSDHSERMWKRWHLRGGALAGPDQIP